MIATGENRDREICVYLFHSRQIQHCDKCIKFLFPLLHSWHLGIAHFISFLLIGLIPAAFIKYTFEEFRQCVIESQKAVTEQNRHRTWAACRVAGLPSGKHTHKQTGRLSGPFKLVVAYIFQGNFNWQKMTLSLGGGGGESWSIDLCCFASR